MEYGAHEYRIDCIDELTMIFEEEIGFDSYTAEQAATDMFDNNLSFEEAVGKHQRR